MIPKPALDEGCASAVIDMYDTGWFGRGPAFWRWVRTSHARPYIYAIEQLYTPIDVTRRYGDAIRISDEVDALLDPQHLEALRAYINAQFGP